MPGKTGSRAPLLVSACLIGSHCRYDGGSRPSVLLRELAMRGRVLPLCPEQLGGLSTPRPPARIAGGTGDEVLTGKAKVLGPAGEVVSATFLLGASRTLTLARRHGCREAVLKERSPSCGVSRLSSPEGSREGRGVTAAILAAAGLRLISDEDKRLASRLREYHDADS